MHKLPLILALLLAPTTGHAIKKSIKIDDLEILNEPIDGETMSYRTLKVKSLLERSLQDDQTSSEEPALSFQIIETRKRIKAKTFKDTVYYTVRSILGMSLNTAD